MQSKHEGLDRLEQLVNDNGDEREIEKAFPSLLNIEAQVASERAKFFNSLSDILTAGQRAKLLTFERSFERELREAVRETQKRRMRSDEP
jgi:hypothetical protein